MYIHYDFKTDYLEILSEKCSNYGSFVSENIFELRAKKTNRVVGHGIMYASEMLEELDFLDPLVKFSVMVKMQRLRKGLTQTKVAAMMGIALVPYQRIESGRNNPTLKTILKIKKIFPEMKLDKVA